MGDEATHNVVNYLKILHNPRRRHGHANDVSTLQFEIIISACNRMARTAVVIQGDEMKVLVVGGAGYIGSNMAKHLCHAGASVTVLDDLSSGYRDAVIEGADLEIGSIADRDFLSALFARNRFDAVMHFASKISVSESVVDPAKYYANNVAGTLALLEAMRTSEVRRFIFSSSAAIYGDPAYQPIDELHPKNPINPYGRSKWMVEQILKDYDCAYGLKSVCLRYFNAAGADREGHLGERHEPETHLIPLILQAASGRCKRISIFGADYDTPDGTCIRDYIHVSDLCEAHALALNYLLEGGDSNQFNLGNGFGFSVMEVIEAARRITGRDFIVSYEARRIGDPPQLVANSSKARDYLGWRPKYTDLPSILADAWTWEKKHPWQSL